MFIKKESLMKFLKSTVAIVALLAIGSVDAKQMGARTATKATQASSLYQPIVDTTKPISIKPVESTDKQVGAQIVRMNSAANSAKDTNNKAINELINSMNKLASNQQKITLLNTAMRIQQAIIDYATQNQNKLLKEKQALLTTSKMGSQGSAIESTYAPKINEETGGEVNETRLF
jgi:hypothetical protein